MFKAFWTHPDISEEVLSVWQVQLGKQCVELTIFLSFFQIFSDPKSLRFSFRWLLLFQNEKPCIDECKNSNVLRTMQHKLVCIHVTGMLLHLCSSFDFWHTFSRPAKFMIGKLSDRPLATIRYISKIWTVRKQWNPRPCGIFPTYENQALGHYSFLLGSEECVLLILQNYVVYFAFFCSVREKNVSEKEVAWTFVATKKVFIVVLSLITFLMSDISLNCHYFGYEWALKCFFEIKLWRYREIWGLPSEKKEHFRAWHYKMCTHKPGLNSGDEIAWSLKWSQIHKHQPPTRLDILNSTELKFDLRVYVYVAFFFLFFRLWFAVFAMRVECSWISFKPQSLGQAARRIKLRCAVGLGR